MSYADDTQLVIAFSKDCKNNLLTFKDDLLAISNWMTANCLQLNAAKSEILVLGRDSDYWSEQWWPDRLKPAPTSKKAVENLGFWIDSDLSFNTQSKALAGSCFGLLRGLRPLLGYFEPKVRQHILQATILAKLDNGNSLYLGASKTCILRLQRILNAAARALLALPKSCSVSSVLPKLHWLPVIKRIQFKSLCIAHKILAQQGQPILTNLLTHCVPNRPSAQPTWL